jgi:hypothetical protein
MYARSEKGTETTPCDGFALVVVWNIVPTNSLSKWNLVLLIY